MWRGVDLFPVRLTTYSSHTDTLFAGDAIPVAVEMRCITRLAPPDWCGPRPTYSSTICIIDITASRSLRGRLRSGPTVAMTRAASTIFVATIRCKPARMGVRNRRSGERPNCAAKGDDRKGQEGKELCPYPPVLRPLFVVLMPHVE